MSLTTVQPGMLGTPQFYGFKNRLINGAAVIDQRTSGAAVTGVSGGSFCVDKWRCGGAFNAGRFTIQQNLNSITPPAGFTNYMGVTTTTAESPPSSGAVYVFVQWIEGYNIADLGFGTANAKTITLSFWARSSLTGTFAGDVTNGSQDRSYVFTYSLPTANTWTYCTVTIPGCTTGTWDTTNGAGMGLRFSLGIGSTYLTSSTNQWLTGQYEGATGQTNVVSTSGATWYMTGAQLEVGVSATTFDYRPYTTELQLCQRYANSTFPIGTAWGTAKGRAGDLEYLSSGTSSRIFVNYVFPVTMRDTPTPTYYNPTNNNTNFYSWSTGSDSSAAGSFVNTSSKGQMIVSASNAAATDNTYGIHASFTADF